ncbi:amidohydrolase [Sphingomonas sp. CL5.1]|uniref:amidohydrolase n=1 Tax=Sphingomonas sp. CL5.1 TaxID=2653203 RepID=UPI001582F30C|nr:amidohydrolase [Sphingomonas sp. CL5.1]QKR99000.1 amidohydrolase [Sphingomonas sp. CL5.1]
MRKTLLMLATVLAALPATAQITPSIPDDAPVTSIPQVAPGFDVAAAKARIAASLDKQYPHLDALYKDLHQHPEVSFQEVRTAGILAAEMRRLGFTVTEKVGKTGIVAILKNGEGPVVMVRTELDALPLEEKTGLPYASRAQQTVDGKLTYVDHACGHDSHMAWWIGAATALVAMKDQWHGTLMFIGQPAEETLLGAKAMIEDGLFKRWPKPDYGFAAHVGPDQVGRVVVKEGAVTSASDKVNITFNGVGAHGSMPDKSIDPVVMGSRFVMDVQTIISRERDPNLFGVISVGSFHAGTVGNIIPDHADLQLTVRSRDAATRKLLLDGITRTARAVAEMARAPEPAVAHPAGTGVVNNDAALSARTASVLAAAFGKDVAFVPTTMPGGNASEDYAAFIEAGVPSVFLAVGGYDPAMIARYKAEGKPVPVNHSPFFAPVPEPTIKRGAETLALAVLGVAGNGVTAK